MTAKVSPKPNPIVSNSLSSMPTVFRSRMYEKKNPLANMKNKPNHPPSNGTDSIGVWSRLFMFKSVKRTIKQMTITPAITAIYSRLLIIPLSNLSISKKLRRNFKGQRD
jgi:hypothetical protein